jgi:IclR family transcriptional regulator, acetate operon repressor
MTTGGMLARGLSLLVALGRHPDGAGLSELSREVGLPVSTVYRLLAIMTASGFVHFDAKRRRYYTGLRVFKLSRQVSLVKRLSDVALPVMHRISDITRESVSMAVREGKDLVYVEWAEGRNRIQISGYVGTRGSLHYTSQGKVLLAFMPENERGNVIREIRLEPRAPNTITDPAELRGDLKLTRERGFALADEENEKGICAIGVPVIGVQGRPLTAISVVAPVSRVSRERLEQFAPLPRDAAREIEVQLPQSNTPLINA